MLAHALVSLLSCTIKKDGAYMCTTKMFVRTCVPLCELSLLRVPFCRCSVQIPPLVSPDLWARPLFIFFSLSVNLFREENRGEEARQH